MRSYLLILTFIFFLTVFSLEVSQEGGAGAYFSWQGTPLDEPPAHLGPIWAFGPLLKGTSAVLPCYQHTFHLYLQPKLEPRPSNSQPSTLQTAATTTATATHIYSINQICCFKKNLFKLRLDSISHQDDPLHCKSSACMDARALITDLQTSQNLQWRLPSAVRRRAEVRVGPNELLAPSQEFYEVPKVSPGLARETEWSITCWHLMIAGCSPLSHGCSQK